MSAGLVYNTMILFIGIFCDLNPDWLFLFQVAEKKENSHPEFFIQTGVAFIYRS